MPASHGLRCGHPGIERDDEAFAANSIDHGAQETVIGAFGPECRRSNDDPMSTLLYQEARTFRGADATADPAFCIRCEQFHQGVIRAAVHGGIEIDNLDFRESLKALQHGERGIAFESFIAALDELDDFAAH